MTVLLTILAAAVAVLGVHLYHRHARREQAVRDSGALTAVMRERNEARSERDSYGDALRDIIDRAYWADMAAVRATARAALAIGSYSGELASARDALRLSAAQNAALRERLAAAGLPVDADEEPDAVEPVFHGHQKYRKEEDIEP